jgi:hypothetical protein
MEYAGQTAAELMGPRNRVHVPPGRFSHWQTGAVFLNSPPFPKAEISQDRYGDFMVVLLTGSIAVDRVQPWVGSAAHGKPGPVMTFGRDVAAGQQCDFQMHHTGQMPDRGAECFRPG